MSDEQFDADLDDSTVQIAGRRFPAVGLICPLTETENTPDVDRLLGGRGGHGNDQFPYTHLVYVPCENGLLVGVEQRDGDPGYDCSLYCRSCVLAPWMDEHIYIPRHVVLDGRTLAYQSQAWFRGEIRTTTPRGQVYWHGAEADWLAEFIDRVSVLPFTPPPGPQATPVPLADAYRLTVS